MVEYVNNGRNCRLVIVGDKGQLPPVGKVESPALDESVLRIYAQNLYSAHLWQVVRQAKESMILENATTVRNMIEQVLSFPVLTLSDRNLNPYRAMILRRDRGCLLSLWS